MRYLITHGPTVWYLVQLLPSKGNSMWRQGLTEYSTVFATGQHTNMSCGE